MSVCLFVSISVINQNMNYMHDCMDINITWVLYTHKCSAITVKRSRHGPECDPLVV